MREKEKSGYLYVLVHPDLPGYYKLGQTTKHPTERLKNHNNDPNRILGKLVQLTNKPWQLLYYVPVSDARRAESATLWYDVLPRWDNLELNNNDVIGIIEDIIKSPYLDIDRYNVLLETELMFYDYKAMLKALELNWTNKDVVEKCKTLVEQVKEERNKNDKRRRLEYG